MLRITFDKGPEAITLKLEGELSGLWVDELRRVWNDVRGEEKARPTAVDLSEVTFLSSEGQALLERMFREGANLWSGPYVSVTGFILNRLKQQSSQEPAVISLRG